MIYERTFYISAAHLNSARAYELLDELITKRSLPYPQMLELLSDCHGHNFKIVVTVAGRLGATSSDWLVDDPEIEKAVMEWNNCNLSMHDDFRWRTRATTERMAYLLFDKLVMRGFPVSSVKVYETDCIFAEACLED